MPSSLQHSSLDQQAGLNGRARDDRDEGDDTWEEGRVVSPAEGMALVVAAGSVVDTGGWLWGGEVPGGRGGETLAIPGYSNQLPNYLLACRSKQPLANN